MRFDEQALEQAVGSSNIRSAKLRLYIASNADNWGSTGREVNVHRMTQTWSEAGATWNCPSDLDTSNSSANCDPGWDMGGATLPPFVIAPTKVILHQNSQRGWVEWDVTPDVRKFLSHQATNFGWIIRKDDEALAGQVDYASRETLNPPQLILNITLPGCDNLGDGTLYPTTSIFSLIVG